MAKLLTDQTEIIFDEYAGEETNHVAVFATFPKEKDCG